RGRSQTPGHPRLRDPESRSTCKDPETRRLAPCRPRRARARRATPARLHRGYAARHRHAARAPKSIPSSIRLCRPPGRVAYYTGPRHETHVMPSDTKLTYKNAGVDIDAGEALVERIKAPVKRTLRPEVIGG